MIKSFADKGTAAVFSGLVVRRLPHDIQTIARRKLKLIDAVSKVEELRIPPGNRLEQLKGNRAGQWSIRINDQWRICFKWENGHAEEVEIVDYH
ncbi:MAG: type II toxin-antitoxin system RelE/ParE family toxin [Nitrosomonadales bacterium]|nr:type II toxin-antitoxin system RelE/ParE family toxin [Nitrosomonadales bacterium]